MRYRAVHLGLEYRIFQTSTTALIVRELEEGNDASLTHYVLLTLLECQIYCLNAYVCFCLCVVVVCSLKYTTALCYCVDRNEVK